MPKGHNTVVLSSSRVNAEYMFQVRCLNFIFFVCLMCIKCYGSRFLLICLKCLLIYIGFFQTINLLPTFKVQWCFQSCHNVRELGNISSNMQLAEVLKHINPLPQYFEQFNGIQLTVAYGEVLDI